MAHILCATPSGRPAVVPNRFRRFGRTRWVRPHTLQPTNKKGPFWAPFLFVWRRRWDCRFATGHAALPPRPSISVLILKRTRREKQKAPEGTFCFSGGEGGIRTHEGQLTLAGFQDQCIQPLCHLSKLLIRSSSTSALTRCVPAPRPAGRSAVQIRS